MAQSSPARTTIYVNNAQTARRCQDGRSWRTAFADLQSGLDAAAATANGARIWIAAGTYLPSKLYAPNGVPGGAAGITTVAMNTFSLPDNVALYGGFVGTECRLSERDIRKHRTVLSGAGVSWHVVIAGNDVAKTGVRARLDGLTISGGVAQGPAGAVTLFAPFTYLHSSGAGLYAIFGSALCVSHVTFADNAASGAGGEGGGLFSINCDLVVRRCRFEGNSAAEEGGGIEILNTFETSPHRARVERSTFVRNSATDFGGAIVAEGTQQNPGSMAIVRQCTFEQNTAQLGGAVAVDSLRVDVEECQFRENFSAVAGGALSTSNIVNTISTASQVPPLPLTPYPTTVTRCDFANNVTAGNLALHDLLLGGVAAGIDFPLGGGAVVTYLNGWLRVRESQFRCNEARNSDGGAILNGRSAAQNPLGIPVTAFIARTAIEKCRFEANRSLGGSGGAVASQPSTYAFSPPLIVPTAGTVLDATDSVFERNVAAANGGAIYLLRTTAALGGNCFDRNRACRCDTVFGADSAVRCRDGEQPSRRRRCEDAKGA